jgi:hypothetical protein
MRARALVMLLMVSSLAVAGCLRPSPARQPGPAGTEYETSRPPAVSTITPTIPPAALRSTQPNGTLPTTLFYVGYPDWDGIYFYRMGRDSRLYGLTGAGQRTVLDFDLSADGRVPAYALQSTGAITMMTDTRMVPDVKVDATCGAFAISPTGDRIVFGARDEETGAPTLRIVNPDGTNLRVLASGSSLTRTACHPRWSSDGSTIAYLDEGRVVRVRHDGTSRRVTAVHGLPNGYVIHGLTSLSWDGRRAVLDGSVGPCTCDERRYWGIAHGNPYVVDLDTGRATKLDSPDGLVVGAVFDAHHSLVARVRTGNRYAIELLSLDGRVLDTRVEPPLEGTVDKDAGQTIEVVHLVGFAP